jgi:hypothetical protein
VEDQDNPTDVADPVQAPPGGLYAPNLSGGVLPDDSVAGIVARLMSPPPPFYNNEHQSVTLTINWAVGVAGPERFERHGAAGRYFLNRGDELGEQGEATGLSSEILEWLKHGEETLTLPVEHFQ